MNKRKLIISLAALAVIAASGIGMILLSGLKKEPWKPVPKEHYRYVETASVAYQTTYSEISATGRLASIEQVAIFAEVPGRLLPGSVPLKKGETFRKGALLFKIDSREEGFSLIAQRSRFLSAVARLIPDIQVDFPDRFDDWNGFLNHIDIREDLPRLPAIATPKEKVFLSGRNILNDYYSVKSAEVKLKKYDVFAPFDGTYTEVALEVGANAAIGNKVAAIIRTDKMELEVPVHAVGAQWIGIGSDVDVTDIAGNRNWQGKVVRKTSFIDSATQSISVFIRLHASGPQPLLKNLFLRAFFHGVAFENTMEVPRSAVFNNHQVYIVDNDLRLRKRNVTLHLVKNRTVVISGLKEGTRLVTESLLDAREGTKVSIGGHS